MKILYHVICFTDKTKRATIHKTYKTLTRANKFIELQRGKHDEIMLRQENIHIDTPNAILSIDKILSIIEL